MKEKPIAEVLKDWRNKKDLSQQAAAQFLEISISALQSWEQGRKKPSRFTAGFIRANCK
jgi:DNA-binding transcriptional regulator YiaG